MNNLTSLLILPFNAKKHKSSHEEAGPEKGCTIIVQPFSGSVSQDLSFVNTLMCSYVKVSKPSYRDFDFCEQDLCYWARNFPIRTLQPSYQGET